MAKANPLLELCRDDQLLAVHKPAGLIAGHPRKNPGFPPGRSGSATSSSFPTSITVSAALRWF